MGDPRVPVALGPSDLDDVLALNELWVPHVGTLDRGRLAEILGEADLALVVHGAEGGPAGFVIALGGGARYDSPNYRWFARRHDRFTYVDRVAVEPAEQGRGVGRALYAAVAEHADAVGSTVMCAEVNLQPPNPDSQAFHAAQGFEEVGRQWTYGHTVEVQLLERPL